MHVRIIHRPARKDRDVFVSALLAVHRRAVVVDAVECPWETPAVGAVRGCCLSHLKCLMDAPPGPLLVLEDDAMVREAWKWFGDAAIPPDAGVVLLGAETDAVPLRSGFGEVTTPFLGSHAVLYTSSLRNSPYVHVVNMLLASVPVGNPPGVTGWCYEAMIQHAVKAVGLKVYRPASMTHLAGGTVSDRSGGEQRVRDRNADLPLVLP